MFHITMILSSNNTNSNIIHILKNIFSKIYSIIFRIFLDADPESNHRT